MDLANEGFRGRLVQDRTTKAAKMNCRNWECGVVVPVEAQEGHARGGAVGMEVFEGRIPVPMQVPGADYAGRRPWFSSEA
jgi:hypothetical protein